MLDKGCGVDSFKTRPSLKKRREREEEEEEEEEDVIRETTLSLNTSPLPYLTYPSLANSLVWSGMVSHSPQSHCTALAA